MSYKKYIATLFTLFILIDAVSQYFQDVFKLEASVRVAWRVRSIV
jgi:hypothetical protein